MMVVKFGGHAMNDENGLFAAAINSAHTKGESVVVVHGGGPQIDSALKATGVTPTFVGGFRYTTPAIFDVVNRVLADEVGPALVAKLHKAGVDAIALSGYRDQIITAMPLAQLVDGTPIDLGWVGKVKEIKVEPLLAALSQGQTVVLSPVAIAGDLSHGFNVNADLAAAAVAGALGASQLIVMTDVPGIYRSWPDQSTLIAEIGVGELAAIKGSFGEGMAPKVQACLDAISAGARAVRIIDGTNPVAFEDALAGRGGTLVTA